LSKNHFQSWKTLFFKILFNSCAESGKHFSGLKKLCFINFVPFPTAYPFAKKTMAYHPRNIPVCVKKILLVTKNIPVCETKLAPKTQNHTRVSNVNLPTFPTTYEYAKVKNQYLKSSIFKIVLKNPWKSDGREFGRNWTILTYHLSIFVLKILKTVLFGRFIEFNDFCVLYFCLYVCLYVCRSSKWYFKILMEIPIDPPWVCKIRELFVK